MDFYITMTTWQCWPSVFLPAPPSTFWFIQDLRTNTLLFQMNNCVSMLTMSLSAPAKDVILKQLPLRCSTMSCWISFHLFSLPVSTPLVPSMVWMARWRAETRVCGSTALTTLACSTSRLSYQRSMIPSWQIVRRTGLSVATPGSDLISMSHPQN